MFSRGRWDLQTQHKELIETGVDEAPPQQITQILKVLGA